MQVLIRIQRLALAALFALLALACGDAMASPPLPAHLSETGLFADGSTAIKPGLVAFSPQYVLWSDGASKRRWLQLPPGSTIDASNPDAWEFPAGTRLWKEFSHGRPIETRYIERLQDGTWRYATYVWNAAGTDAELASEFGLPNYTVDGAPGGRYPIPSRDDCRACHEAAAVPVLGFSALQLSPDRDPQALHAESRDPAHADLPTLVANGLLTGLTATHIEQPPRINAVSPTARAALGYLHANCGHCHNDAGPLELVGLFLAQRAGTGDQDKILQSLLERRNQFVERMQSRDPLLQMPPLGTRLPDVEALALIERWVRLEL